MRALPISRLGIAAASVVLVAAGLIVASAGASRSDHSWVHFVTEDGNIECVANHSLGNNEPLDCVMHSNGYDPTAPDDTNYHPH
jgi:hypothetical protein